MPPRRKSRSAEELPGRAIRHMAAGSVDGLIESASPVGKRPTSKIAESRPHVLLFSIPEAAAAQIYMPSWRPLLRVTINKVWANCSVAPSGANCEIDILIQGSSAFPTSPKPIIPNGAFVGAAAVPDDKVVNPGWKLEIEVLQPAGASFVVVSMEVTLL